jgi:hypothetical protein
MIEAWFRAQDSNLRFWVQSPASCLLDDPGSVVGPEGFEPSRSRVRAECASSCATDPLVGREGLEPSSLGLKARCSPVERASLSDAWRCFFSSSCSLLNAPKATWSVSEAAFAAA